MKIIITAIFSMWGIWCQAQLSTNQKIQVTAMIKAATDPLWSQVTWLRKGKTADSIRINTLTTQHFNQQSQINDLLTLTVAQSNDINNLKTLTVLQQTQINKLQDSLKLIPFVIVDTMVVPGKQNLTFRKNILSVTK